jgi:hypothetical protein
MSADQHKPAGTTELINELLREVPEPQPGEPEPQILLDDLMNQFRQRAFGVFLLVVIFPAYIAVALGIGGVSGVLSILCGCQMMLGFERPWLPKFARNFGLPRRQLASFARRTEPWFRRLEKIVKPRHPEFTQRRGDIISGLVIVLMGIALFLPIPLTNFVFAIPLTVLAFALIERDGLVIAICWGVSFTVLTSFTYLTFKLGTSFMPIVIAWIKSFF